MATYDFRILLETVKGDKYSYRTARRHTGMSDKLTWQQCIEEAKEIVDEST